MIKSEVHSNFYIHDGFILLLKHWSNKTIIKMDFSVNIGNIGTKRVNDFATNLNKFDVRTIKERERHQHCFKRGRKKF